MFVSFAIMGKRQRMPALVEEESSGDEESSEGLWCDDASDVEESPEGTCLLVIWSVCCS